MASDDHTVYHPIHTYVHENMPLVTVTRSDQLNPLVLEGDSRWGTFRLEVGKADEVERACEMPMCRYYYAGRAAKEYGDMAFAYGPDAETGQHGMVNPFDSGGLYFGGFYPFKEGPPASEKCRKKSACGFIEDTQIELQAWRGQFLTYLEQCYDHEVQNYLKGEPPQDRGQPRWGHQHLPVWQHDNSKWAAWTWEIRLQDHPPLEQGLQVWSASGSDFTTLAQNISLYCDKTGDFRAKALNEVKKKHLKFNDTDQSACDVINRWVMESTGLKEGPL